MAIQDRDLLSIQQARTLAQQARAAQKQLAGLSQEQVDRIVEAMAMAARSPPPPAPTMTISVWMVCMLIWSDGC